MGRLAATINIIINHFTVGVPHLALSTLELVGLLSMVQTTAQSSSSTCGPWRE